MNFGKNNIKFTKDNTRNNSDNWGNYFYAHKNMLFTPFLLKNIQNMLSHINKNFEFMKYI